MARGYKYANDAATRMMAEGLKRASDERGLSVRKIAPMLNYSQAVVLSHMALGRVPIPLDRAEDIAGVLGLDKAEFLRLVAKQRHPEVDWQLLSNHNDDNSELEALSHDLELIAGMPLIDLSAEHKAVLREVVGSAHPRRRWLSEHEVPVISMLRSQKPHMHEVGLNEVELANLKVALISPARRA